MDSLTPSDLLQSLPGLLYMWSLIVLGWGLIAWAVIYQIAKRSPLHQCTPGQTGYNSVVLPIAAVNIFLTWYLVEYHNTVECSTWIVVVNVFYTAHLLYLSLGVAKWWKIIQRKCTNTHAHTASEI